MITKVYLVKWGKVRVMSRKGLRRVRKAGRTLRREQKARRLRKQGRSLRRKEHIGYSELHEKRTISHFRRWCCDKEG